MDCSAQRLQEATTKAARMEAGKAQDGRGQDAPSFFTRNNTKDCEVGQGGTTDLVAVGCKCRCRFCPGCAQHLGLVERQRLKAALTQFKGVLMLSLTIDPKEFESPDEAYRFVRKNRLIARLIRELDSKNLLHSRRFWWVLECQKNGQPHWHVLLDADFIPHDVVSRLWHQMGPNGIVGHAWISKRDFENKAHAANYACKYVIKHPKQGWPEWVMDFEGQIHRFGHSRNFYPTEKKKKKTEKTKESPRRKTVRERLRHCNQTVVILERTTSIVDGVQQVWHRFVDRVGVSLDFVQRVWGKAREFVLRGYSDIALLRRMSEGYS